MKNEKIDILLGKKVKEIRMLRGLTLEDLGDMIGVKKATISRYESGDRGMSIEVLIKICKALNTDYTKVIDSVVKKIH